VTATRWQVMDGNSRWGDLPAPEAAWMAASGLWPVRLWSPPCDLCDRSEGSRAGRHGEPVDPMGGELGPVRVCEVCGRLACPECYAESVCCGTNH
jgi:hypothetical protein